MYSEHCWATKRKLLIHLLLIVFTKLQGSPSGSSEPPVDIKTKVAFQSMVITLIRNFCFDVNMRLGTT